MRVDPISIRHPNTQPGNLSENKMSDWDFLYEMRDRGYSAEEIAEAAGCGVAPWEWEQIEKQEEKAEGLDLPIIQDTRNATYEKPKTQRDRPARH